MRRVVGSFVAVVVVLSSSAALASGDAVADLRMQIRSVANAKTAAATATVDPARGIDLGLGGVNVAREAKTGGDVATTAAEQNAAATPSSGLHH